MNRRKIWPGSFPLLALAVMALAAAGCSARIGFRALPRDAFPVFDNPVMLTAAEAEEQEIVFARDAVIGVQRNGEAKAYPIRVMGIHELGNDTIGGIPIAVT